MGLFEERKRVNNVPGIFLACVCLRLHCTAIHRELQLDVLQLWRATDQLLCTSMHGERCGAVSTPCPLALCSSHKLFRGRHDGRSRPDYET